MSTKENKIVGSFLKGINKTVEDFNSQKNNVSKVTLNNRLIESPLNLVALSLQGLKGEVALISKKQAEKTNIDTSSLKKVSLFIVDNSGKVIRYYQAYVVSMTERKKVMPETVGVVPLRSDNVKSKGSLIDSVTSLLKPEPVTQYAVTEEATQKARIDSLEVKLNRIEELLIDLTKKKK